jgi:hypothetical protein
MGLAKTMALRNILPSTMKANPYMYFKKNSTLMYVRTPFDATNDLVQYLKSVKDGTNIPIFAFGNTYLLDKTTAYTNAANWAGTLWHAVDDDNAPLYYNGSYNGANHAPYACRTLTVISHDKTAADLGSAWQDAGAKTWYLVKIISATSLQVISDFGTDETNGYWTFNTAIGASPLTHVSGATHTADITFSATAVSGFFPMAKNVSTTVWIDGLYPPVDGTVYQCAFLDIKESYDICDPRTTLAYMKANIGKTIVEAVADSTVTADASIVNRFRFFPNGSCVQYTSLTTVNYLNELSFSAIQSYKLQGDNLYQYIPRVNPYVGSVKTWDFTTPELISGTFETVTLVNATHSKDADNPPFRFTQISKTSGGVPTIGFTLGYSLTKLDSVDTSRAVSAATAYTIDATTRKQYPRLIYATSKAGGLTFSTMCYRGYFDPNNVNGATVYQYHEEGNELIVDIDYHTSVDHVCLPIPANWYGKTVSTLHSDGTITIHTGTVTGAGVVVSVTDYGSATLKIS